MNTVLSRAGAALASVLITLAMVTGIDSLAGPGHADPRLVAAIALAVRG